MKDRFNNFNDDEEFFESFSKQSSKLFKKSIPYMILGLVFRLILLCAVGFGIYFLITHFT